MSNMDTIRPIDKNRNLTSDLLQKFSDQENLHLKNIKF